jgi:hypothetical protein
MRRILVPFTIATCFATLPAQIALTDGNTSTVLGPLAPLSVAPPAFALRGDALTTNHGYQHGWYYRVAGDTREFSLRAIGGVTSGVVPGDLHGDVDLANVDNRGLLKASLDYDIYDAGPASGVLISRLTLMNRSNAPVTVNVFGYVDLDVGATTADQVIANPNSHFVSDVTGVQVEVRGIGNDLTEVGLWPAVLNKLTNATLTTLNNSVAPLTGDYTGAFQWQDRTLAPFEQRTFQVVFAIDTAALVIPLVDHYGAGNGSSFEVHSQSTPLQDNTQPRTFSVQMKGALPGALYRIASAFNPWTPAPFIPGIDLWVEPVSIFAVFGGLTSPTGEAQEVFTIPPSPYLTGFSVYHQCFYVDAAAPNGFAYWTPGLRTRIGKL